MSHSFVNILVHCIFSTKERRRLITPDLQRRLWAYMGGIAREHKMRALEVGGVEDHAHMLLSMSRTMDIGRAMQLIKGGSSAWVHQEFPHCQQFAWQEGYGAFSVGTSQVHDTRRYIANQHTHHRNMTFQEEFVEILRRHGMPFDENEIWR